MKFDGFFVVEACMWCTDDGDLYLRLVNPTENVGTWVKAVRDCTCFETVPLAECERLTKMMREFNGSCGGE